MEDGTIQHLLVLMLENRSFDHMLGYLDYPPEAGFEGIRGREQEFGNPLPDGSMAFPGSNAGYLVHPGPGHSHDDVMQQLLGDHDLSRPYQIANNGFAADYDTHYNPGHGATAVQCFAPECLPVEAALAKEFAVCDHWFCSVPGATWPNRNFVHACTSDGQVNIVVRAYKNKTIFEQLSEANRDWAVYYGGFPPQSLAFSRLWLPWELNWLQRFKPIDQLFRAIRFDRLPHYAWIEPDMVGRLTNSQHPGMSGEMDFRAAEHLIWEIYTALRQNPEVFAKTLFVLTYDEHGGFFDHVPPPQGPEWSVAKAYTTPDGSYTFPFDLLGLRVPAILVSPWVEAGAVDHTVYDHTSIAATVRRLFHVAGGPLDGRDGHANTFERVLTRSAPRDLPDLPEPVVDQAARKLIIEPDLRNSLVQMLTETVWSELRSRAQQLAELDAPGPIGVADLPPEPEEAHEEIMADIAPRLSPEAQAILAQPPLPPDPGLGAADAGPPGVRAVINFLNHKAEQLGSNLALVDDLMLFVDMVLRRFVEGHRVLLRTAGGDSIEQPDAAALRAALNELRSSSDASARLWLSDHQDRWLTVEPGGRVSLDEPAAGPVRTLHNLGPQRVLKLLTLFSKGDIAHVRSAFS